MLYLDGDGIHHLSPVDEPSFRVGWDVDLHPGEILVDAVAALGLAPVMVHSTSWRMDSGHLVLTFLVVVEPPGVTPEGQRDELVARVELARGHLLGPPPDVHLSQVVEHGLRHLAWLVHDDPAIREALPDWSEALSDYRGEPFRSFGGTPKA